jgi:hypothetical protein
MEIPESLKQIYDHLSVHNRRFLEYVDETPGGTEREVYEELFKVNNDLIDMQPWPIFINRRSREEIGAAVVKVFRLLKRIPFDIFEGDPRRIADYYGISPQRAAALLEGVTQPHMDNLIGRGDCIVSPSGLKFVEFNVNTNLGGMETETWLAAYRSVPLIRRFLDRHGIALRNRKLLELLFELFVDNLVEHFGNTAEGLNIGVAVERDEGKVHADSMELYLDSIYNKVLLNHRTEVKGRVIVGEYSRFSVEGDTVVCDGIPIHALVEMYVGYVPPGITEVFKKGNILVYNGPVSWLMATKSSFALLSERENDPVFSPEEQETIRKHIPWTRKITDCLTTYKGEEVKLVDFILSNRERLVLKPPVGSGGSGIFVGRKTSDREWRHVVETSLAHQRGNPGFESPGAPSQQDWEGFLQKTSHMETWLVQECVDSHPFIFQRGEDDYEPHDGAWGFFVFGDRYAGGWTRVLPSSNEKGVVNAHQGAQMAMIFDVDE